MSATRHAAARKGWSNRGGYRFTEHDPLRNSCRWNPKEDYDLLDAFTSGRPIAALAFAHQRKINAIEMRLFTDRALNGATAYMAEAVNA